MYPLTTPFILSLPKDHERRGQVECLRAVRIVPGKRSVYQAKWNDKDVFVKLFIHPHRAVRHWRKERDGAQVLADRRILSPSLLYAGRLNDNRAYVLITEALPDARTISQQWRCATDDDARQRLLRLLVEALAAQHAAGVLQRDLHLDNFLITGGRIYSIDTSEILLPKRPLGKRTSIKNLGLLLAQLPPWYDRSAPTVFASYASARRWPVSNDDQPSVQACIDRARAHRKNRFLTKIFRECTAFAVKKTNGKICVYDRDYSSAGFDRLYHDPESFFSLAGVRYLKKGRSSTVAQARVDGIEVLVKRYNVKGTWHHISHALRNTRASLSWHNAHLLRFYHVPTPKPIAFVEKRSGPVRHSSYFVSQYVEGPNCRQYYEDRMVSVASKQHMAEQICQTLATLGRYRIRHGDMKATNLIASHGQAVLTDLDAMRQYRTTLFFRRAHRRDIRRLLDNWANQPEVQKIFQDKLAILA